MSHAKQEYLCKYVPFPFIANPEYIPNLYWTLDKQRSTDSDISSLGKVNDLNYSLTSEVIDCLFTDDSGGRILI